MCGEQTAATVLGQRLDQSNWLRNGITVYLHCAGIEAGYGFFAPNVPANYKLVFELRYPDGRTEYNIPRVGSAATGLRSLVCSTNWPRSTTRHCERR